MAIVVCVQVASLAPRHRESSFHGVFAYITERRVIVLNILDLFFTAVALSMDAFAVSISKGLSVSRVKLSHSMITGTYFGGFQALMPLIGFLLAGLFADEIRSLDHWIAFVLLAVIGVNMIREALSKEEEKVDCSFCFRAMLPLAIATSIDALAAGVSFAFADANIWIAISLIGATTFLFSAAGVKIGNVFGSKYKSKAELLGGAILVLMGVKILIEHLCEG